MSEESALAPGQKLGVWIMSGSLALVAVIGGAIAVNSADKSVEEGNPTTNQTVAPGGGHTLGSTESADPADPAGSDPEVGVLRAQLTDASTAGRVQEAQLAVPPVFLRQDPSPTVRQEAPAQTTRPRVGGSVPESAGRQPDPVAPGAGRPRTNLEPAPPDHDAPASETETADELFLDFAIPTVPGDYVFTASVDGMEFIVQVRVGEDGQVTVPALDQTSTPYHYDPVAGRLTATLPPADLGYAGPAGRDPSQPAAAATSEPRAEQAPDAEEGDVAVEGGTDTAGVDVEQGTRVIAGARIDEGAQLATGPAADGHGSAAASAVAEDLASIEMSEPANDHSYAEETKRIDTPPTALTGFSGKNRPDTQLSTPGKPSSAGQVPTPHATAGEGTGNMTPENSQASVQNP